MPVTFTLDLEDHRAGSDTPVRCGPPTERLLEWLAERRASATFFVVASLAREEPDLVRAVADAGHEVSLHCLHHVPIEETGEQRFLAELREGKAILEDLTGRAAPGYRAPIFSLTRRVPWAVPAIVEAGFRYSSSVLPANSPLHGMGGVPRTPFRWEEGLIELPVPVLGRGRASLPFLGGVYLRYLPMPVITRAAAGIAGRPGAWTYLHPYDLDPEEPFEVLPHAGYATSRLVHHRRRGTLDRVDRVVRACGGLGPTLADVAAGLHREDLPVVPMSGAPASA